MLTCPLPLSQAPHCAVVDKKVSRRQSFMTQVSADKSDYIFLLFDLFFCTKQLVSLRVLNVDRAVVLSE